MPHVDEMISSDVESEFGDSTIVDDPVLPPAPTTSIQEIPTTNYATVNESQLGRAFHLKLDYSVFVGEPIVDAMLNDMDDDELFGRHMRTVNASATQSFNGAFTTGGIAPQVNPNSLDPITVVTQGQQVEPQQYTKQYLLEVSKYLGYRPTDVVLQTLNNTTQLGTTVVTTYPMKRHFKARYPQRPSQNDQASHLLFSTLSPDKQK
jgi:hypothetical protein